MFWGLVLEPGKRYSTTVEKSFRVTKAVLDCSSVKSDAEILSVVLETEGSESLLCNLCKQKSILQETLDLNFMTGDRLTFECRGLGRVHLSGYLLQDEDDDISGMLGDEDESEEEEEESGWTGDSIPAKPKKEKRKSDGPPDNPTKKKKTVDKEEDDDDDDEEGDSDEENDSELSDDDDMEDEEEGEEADEDDEEDESDEEDDSAEVKVIANKNKSLNKTPNKQQPGSPKKTPITNGMTPKEQKSNKKTPNAGMTPNANNSPGGKGTPKVKQVLEGGVVIKDIKPGEGQVAKPGKMVTVYYIGRLKDGSKVFDKQLKGEGFKFKLGKGEVIKGWDIGVQGMKVGGKRTIQCPPGVAYGAKGAPPNIPPNSSLVFEVELKSVH